MEHDHVTVPVLIAGGGGAGLTASMLLSTLGIDTLLVNAAETTSRLPKAHVLNQRTMEILRDLGVDRAVYAAGTPAENMSHTAWYAGAAGPHGDYGRRIARMEAWGGGGANPDWAAASPQRQANLPQIRLEPILRRRAEELSPRRVLFGHELVGFTQDQAGVLATVCERSSGATFTVSARYLLGCDGGRFVGPSLGVEMSGMRDVQRVVSFHISADLSPWCGDPDVLIRWIFFPHTGGRGVLVPMGPSRWGPESEEWVFHLAYEPGDERALDDAAVTADMRQALGIGDHPITVHLVSRWSLEGVLAERFQVGRVFLLGDAAHRHPPTGGLGLNAAVQDAHNLCWKLAAVLGGQASEELLLSYEAERKPVTGTNVQRSLENALQHIVTAEMLGMSGRGGEENWRALRRLWSDDPADADFRGAVRRSLAAQSMEFNELNVEYGYTYDSTAVVGDGTPPPECSDPVRIYHPCARPGHPLPHARLEDLDGTLRDIMDLVRPGSFLLIAGENGRGWCEAAARVAADSGVALDTVRIGHVDGDYFDPRSTWTRVRGHGPDGAVLVRPDRYVCWRAVALPADPDAALRAALDRILARGVAVG